MKLFHYLIILIPVLFAIILQYNNQIFNSIDINSSTHNYKPYKHNKQNINNNKMTSKAIVIGGTGATGKHLIRELIASPHFSQVTSLVRREDTSIESEKLKQVVVDFEKLGDYKNEFEDKDVAFDVFGTTKKQAGSAEKFVEIDYGYSAKFSELAKDSGVRSMHLLTSMGSNPNSWFLYPKTKGQLEEKMKSDNFKYLSIFRPGLLERGVSDRWVENVLTKVLSGLKVETLAKAMVINAENEIKNQSTSNAVQVFTNKEIYALVEGDKK